MDKGYTDFHQMIVLKNYNTFKKDKDETIIKSLPFIDCYLLTLLHTEIILTNEYLNNNKDIENYSDIKRLNDKHKKAVEIEINSRIEE